MDVSKLPKLSDTQKEQQVQQASAGADANPPIAEPPNHAGQIDPVPAMGIGEAWPSIAINKNGYRSPKRATEPWCWLRGTIPAGQRATEASLRARLTAALDRNKQLGDENARLRRQLARALGDQRSARTRSGNDPED